MPPNSQPPSYDRDHWLRALEEIAKSLGVDGLPVHICLIGSAACLFGGMEGRTSRDLNMTSNFTRNQELLARTYLAKPDLLTQAIIDKRWGDVALAVSFAQADAPVELGSTDPALYREIRENITRFYLRGGGAINLAKIKALADQSLGISTHDHC